MPSIPAMQKRAERLIRSWGGDQKGQIVRGGTVRATAFMALNDYSPRERGLFADGSVRLAVSAVGLAELDYNQDTIVFLGKTFKLPVPVGGGRPDGTVVYFDANAIQVQDPA